MSELVSLRKHKDYKSRKYIADSEKKQLLRFNSESINFMSNIFVENPDSRGGGLSAVTKMEVFLRYMSDPGFQSGVGEDFGIHRSTVCKTVSYVADKIVEKSFEWLKFPSTHSEFNTAQEKWQNRFKMPCTIGAIDCTHIQIKKPHQFGDVYVSSRKGFATLNVQATCDANEYFTSVDAQWPGTAHDSRIWKRSNIYSVLKHFKGTFCLLGDSGYGITPWLLTPFKNCNTAAETKFNRIHKAERVIIERCFGQLKQRFPVLGNRVRLNIQNIPKIIVACCVLHNIGKFLNDELVETTVAINDEDEEYENNDLEEVVLRYQGQQKRAEIAQLLNRLY